MLLMVFSWEDSAPYDHSWESFTPYDPSWEDSAPYDQSWEYSPAIAAGIPVQLLGTLPRSYKGAQRFGLTSTAPANPLTPACLDLTGRRARQPSWS